MGSGFILDPSYECGPLVCEAEEGVGASVAGARIYVYSSLNLEEPVAVYGTWAVTAATS
jgi:hypothetical protein